MERQNKWCHWHQSHIWMREKIRQEHAQGRKNWTLKLEYKSIYLQIFLKVHDWTLHRIVYCFDRLFFFAEKFCDIIVQSIYRFGYNYWRKDEKIAQDCNQETNNKETCNNTGRMFAKKILVVVWCSIDIWWNFVEVVREIVDLTVFRNCQNMFRYHAPWCKR
jgi:hypothetical protein